jgi:manganese/zinc/iron transport system ATP- binding protein
LREEGKTVVAVHHDLATGAEYYDDVFMLNTRKDAEGPVASTFTAENLNKAYGGRLAMAQIDQLELATG